MFIRARLVLLGLALLLGVSPAWTQQRPSSPEEELTLDHPVELALKDNREIKVARLEVEMYSDRRPAAPGGTS